MSYLPNLVKRLRQYQRAAKITKARLARAAGLDPSTLRNMHAPDFNPTLKTLKAVDEFLGSWEKGDPVDFVAKE